MRGSVHFQKASLTFRLQWSPGAATKWASGAWHPHVPQHVTQSEDAKRFFAGLPGETSPSLPEMYQKRPIVSWMRWCEAVSFRHRFWGLAPGSCEPGAIAEPKEEGDSEGGQKRGREPLRSFVTSQEHCVQPPAKKPGLTPLPKRLNSFLLLKGDFLPELQEP